MDKEAFLISCMSSPRIGDDGAVIDGTIYSMDAFCEGTHFLREWMSPAQIGRKAMLVNLSDAVAMNADPLYALVSVMIPRQMSRTEIAELSRAMEETAAEYGCEIIGGDTIGGEQLHLSITLISQSDAPLLRTGIREGDLLAYTGELGQVKRDLERLMNGEKVDKNSPFFEPKLRRRFIKTVRPYLRAGMDLSDGLYCDTNKLLDLNGLGMELIREIPSSVGDSGEEYEMLLAFDPKEHKRVEELADKCGVKLTTFARVSHGSKRFTCQSHHF